MRLINRLFQERRQLGLLNPRNVRQLHNQINQARKLPPSQPKLIALDNIAHTLNWLRITDASVEYLLLKVTHLAQQKNLPQILRPNPNNQDITGISQQIALARTSRQNGDFDSAYDTLNNIYQLLQRFND